MEHNFAFQLRTDDIMKMQPVVFGRHYRLLFACAYIPLLVFGLYNVFDGEKLLLSGLMVIPATVMLFDRWLLYPPYLSMRNTNACVKIDDENLTSSLGNKTYDIPWRYFVQHGSLKESDDHFYFKCNLGNIYLPKRAFVGSETINEFRQELDAALGNKFERITTDTDRSKQNAG